MRSLSLPAFYTILVLKKKRKYFFFFFFLRDPGPYLVCGEGSTNKPLRFSSNEQNKNIYTNSKATLFNGFYVD